MASLPGRIRQNVRHSSPVLKTTCALGICFVALCTGLQAQEPAAHLSVTQRVLAITSFDNPLAVAVDPGGNLYVPDHYAGTVIEVQLSDGVYLDPVTLLQGLDSPFGIAADAQGNLYITEQGNTNNVIKETASSTPEGNVYTRSVIPVNGLGVPSGIAVDPIGNLYIADSSKNLILKETPSGSSYTQSVLPSSVLSSPYGVAVDAHGNVLIADWGHNRVLRETISGSSYSESVVTNTDNNPLGVAVDRSGNIYVLNFVDQETSSLLKETPLQGAYVQTVVALATPSDAAAIAADGSGNIYLTFAGTHGLQKLVIGAADFGPNGVAAASLPSTLVFTFDKPGTIAAPVVLTQGASGGDFSQLVNVGGDCGTPGSGFVYHTGDSCVVGVIFDPTNSGARYGAVQLRDTAGTPVAQGYVYGVGLAPQLGFPPGVQATLDGALAHPTAVAVDARGGIYVAESTTGKIYKETSSSARTLIAQGVGNPAGLAIDGAGNLYIAASSSVYKETLGKGGYLQSEIVVGLDHLAGIALDGNANLYLISSTSGNVHKETLAEDGTYTETAMGEGIANPTGVAVDGAGNIFVADARQGALYKETLREDGTYAQSVLATGINEPAGIAVDGSNHVYVTASGGGAVYEYSQQADGSYLQSMDFALPPMPWGVAVDSRKNLYITRNVGDGALIKIDLADAPVLSFPNTRVGSASADQTVTAANVGNESFFLEPVGSGANPALSPGFKLSSATTCSQESSGVFLGTSDSCTYAIDFVPKAHAAYQGALLIPDFGLFDNVTHSISLRGLGLTEDTTRTTLRISPNPVKIGRGVTLIITVTDATNAAAVPTGTVMVTYSVANVTTSVPLSAGKAVLTMTPSVTGTHTIQAHYNGVDASFASSTIQLDLTVQP